MYIQYVLYIWMLLLTGSFERSKDKYKGWSRTGNGNQEINKMSSDLDKSKEGKTWLVRVEVFKEGLK